MEPVKNYPTVFLPGSIFERYPFLLPNLVCAAVVVLGLLIGILFLEETHDEKKSKRDIGVEVGNRLLSRVCRRKAEVSSESKVGYLEETLAFLAEDDGEQPPTYQSTVSNRPLTASESLRPLLAPTSTQAECKPSLRQAFSTQVILNIVGYGILAL